MKIHIQSTMIRVVTLILISFIYCPASHAQGALMKEFKRVAEHFSARTKQADQALTRETEFFLKNIKTATAEERELFFKQIDAANFKTENEIYFANQLKKIKNNWEKLPVDVNKWFQFAHNASGEHGKVSLSSGAFKDSNWSALKNSTSDLQKKIQLMGYKDVVINNKLDNATLLAIREILNDEKTDFTKMGPHEIINCIDLKIQEKFHPPVTMEPESKISVSITDEIGETQHLEVSDRSTLLEHINKIENSGFTVKEICIDLENKTASLNIKYSHVNGNNTTVGLNTDGHADLYCKTKTGQKLKVNFENDGEVTIVASE